MTALDTDVLTDLLNGNAAYAQRLELVPEADRCLPIVVLEEQFRGRLDIIRKAQAGRVRVSVGGAYDLFLESVVKTRPFSLLPCSSTADALFNQFRSAKIRIGSQDLRIASICIAHDATLVTRNARDYSLVTGLKFDIWN
jgi:tRNA(fMet)-specific endonuclease VapC